MESHLQRFFSMRCCSLFLLFLALSSKADTVEDESLDSYSPIYFGDSSVKVGEPFKINCRISISTSIEWLKDGQTLRIHNLRHGRDDHSYVVTENEIEGERDKTLSTLSVKHALSVHRGKYQCNKEYTNYFELNVIDEEPTTTTTISHFDYKNTTRKFNSNRNRILGGGSGGGGDGGDSGEITLTTRNQDDSYELVDPSSAVTVETFAKKRKPKVEPSDIAKTTTTSYKQKSKNKKPVINVPILDLDDSIEEEEYIDETTFHYLITTTSVPKIRHSKGYHKQNTELTTVPSNSLANMIHTTKKPIPKAAQVIGHYDNVEHKLKSFEIKTPLVLSCNVTAPGFPELKWRKNGTDVDKVESLRGRYKTITEERKFMIDRTDVNDAGLYECYVDSLKESAKFNVYANVVVRVPSNTGVVEGEKLTIHCLVVGTEPSITWTVNGNMTINETTDRYVLEEDANKVKNAIITVKNIVLEDRGDFKCTARSPATEFGNADPATDTSFVRVKGKLAALWPFIGICAEVFILCAIILIYEKRRNKTELEESDTDPNTEQKKKRRNYD